MSLMFDRLDRRAIRARGEEVYGRDMLAETQVFEITNVRHLVDRMKDLIEYVPAAEDGDLPEVLLNADKYPNVAPPFDSYWMEFHQPDGGMERDVLEGDRVGVWVLTITDPKEIDDIDGWRLMAAIYINARRPRAIAVWEIACYRDGTFDDPGLPFWGEIERTRRLERRNARLKADGSLEGLRNDPVYQDDIAALDAAETREEWLRLARQLADRYQEQADRLEDRLMSIEGVALRAAVLPTILTAHSLLACRNVETQDHRPPAASSKRHAKRHGHGKAVFKTLKVNVMGGGTDHGDSVELGDGHRALHLVRGHFKTYTAERPLLGRHVGTYWWTPNVRGNRENGVVVKDYKLETREDRSA